MANIVPNAAVESVSVREVSRVGAVLAGVVLWPIFVLLTVYVIAAAWSDELRDRRRGQSPKGDCSWMGRMFSPIPEY